MSLSLLASAITRNRELIELLHQAHARCDADGLQSVLSELDLNNADLVMVLEELMTHSPFEHRVVKTPPESGDVGRT